MQNRVAREDEATMDTPAWASEIRTLLASWGVCEASAHVRFDWETLDISVEGRARPEQGKGVRALWCAALILGLMFRARNRDEPHPGFVVLDSPLTTYRSRDPEEGDEVSYEVEAAFFRSLLERGHNAAQDTQVIVFENKEPPVDVQQAANHIRFTARASTGRSGLIRG